MAARASALTAYDRWKRYLPRHQGPGLVREGEGRSSLMAGVRQRCGSGAGAGAVRERERCGSGSGAAAGAVRQRQRRYCAWRSGGMGSSSKLSMANGSTDEMKPHRPYQRRIGDQGW
jgi:hypothetical protein